MVAFDGSERCGEAEAYFHDYLDDEGHPPVPAAVIDHIQSCRRCRERLAHLEELLSEAAATDASCPSWRNGRLTAQLQSHFECLDEPVTCTRVKPFLPRLLDPSVKIRIPTPITVHLDHCPECAQDLESLKEFELDAEQLARLSAFYAQCPALSESLGNQAFDRLAALSDRGRSGSSESESISCEDVSWSDIFDCVVLLDLAADESGRRHRREMCRMHVASCAACLERTRALSQTIGAIAERPDSEVVTVCSIAPDVAPDTERTEAPYGDYPLEVKVLDRSRIRSSNDSGVAQVQRARRMRLRPFFRMVALAAAMIPLAILFFINSPTSATGVTVAQINRVLAQAQNIYVAQFGKHRDGTDKLVQETWASRTHGIHILKIGDRHEVSHLKTRRRWKIEGDRVTESNVLLSGKAYDLAEKRMQRLLGMTLGSDQWDAELSKVEDPAQAALGVEVYELAWERSTGVFAETPGKLRVYVDATRNRPRKMEFFQWDRIEEALVMVTTRRFEYLEEGEIQQRFQRLLDLN